MELSQFQDQKAPISMNQISLNIIDFPKQEKLLQARIYVVERKFACNLCTNRKRKRDAEQRIVGLLCRSARKIYIVT